MIDGAILVWSVCFVTPCNFNQLVLSGAMFLQVLTQREKSELNFDYFEPNSDGNSIMNLWRCLLVKFRTKFIFWTFRFVFYWEVWTKSVFEISCRVIFPRGIFGLSPILFIGSFVNKTSKTSIHRLWGRNPGKIRISFSLVWQEKIILNIRAWYRAFVKEFFSSFFV